MKWRTILVAVAGGAFTGAFAALIDPTHFNFRDWIDETHVAEMAFDGAAVTLGGIIFQSWTRKK